MLRKLLLCALLANAAYGQTQNVPLTQIWADPVEPFRIAGNIYYVGARDLASYLITTPKGHVVLDAGTAAMAPQILANIRKLGFRPEDVKILIASHAHFDHVAGLAELKRATGAKFHASRLDAGLFSRGGLDDPQFGNQYPFPKVYPDRLVDDGTRITIGGTTLVAHHTPGHTPGCLTWTTTVREKGRNLSVVFVGSASVPSEYRLRGNPAYPNALEDYRRTFAVLRQLRPDIFLGSHGIFFELDAKRKGEKSFIDPEGYRQYVARAGQSMESRAVE